MVTYLAKIELKASLTSVKLKETQRYLSAKIMSSCDMSLIT